MLQRDEVNHAVRPNFMEGQPHVNSKMRAILVDWLVDVHKKYKLQSETLFLAVGLIDRFLEKRHTARRHLQLVGITALLIAAKFEEQYPPQIQDFVYVTDKAYSKDEVIKMEVSMLSALDFKVCRPTAVNFLSRFQVVNGCSEAHRDLAQYLLELTLSDYKMVKYSPSHLAASAVLLSNKLLRFQPSWSSAAVKHTKMTEHMLKECAKEICSLLEHAEQSSLQAVRKKYSQSKYHSVAKMSFVGPSATSGAEGGKHRRNSTGGGLMNRRSTGGMAMPTLPGPGRFSTGGAVPMDTDDTCHSVKPAFGGC
jgi:cyclin B